MTDRTVSWTSAQPGVVQLPPFHTGASVVAQALNIGGPVTITATADGVSGTADITVEPPIVATVEVQGVTALSIDESFAFGATLRDPSGTILTGRAVTFSLANASPAGARR